MIIFRAEPWTDATGKVRQKGAVEFCGVGVIQGLPRVVCHDQTTGIDFPNYRADIKIVRPDGAKSALDWAWINARRDPRLGLEDALALAPVEWQQWVNSAH